MLPHSTLVPSPVCLQVGRRKKDFLKLENKITLYSILAMKVFYIFTTLELLYVFNFSIFFTKLSSFLIFYGGFDFALLDFVLK